MPLIHTDFHYVDVFRREREDVYLSVKVNGEGDHKSWNALLLCSYIGSGDAAAATAAVVVIVVVFVAVICASSSLLSYDFDPSRCNGVWIS